MPQVMTGDDMQRVIRRISHEIVESHRGVEDLVLVGIHTRGVPLADRLGETLARVEDSFVPVGQLDIGLYRDDRSTRGEVQSGPTEIPDSVDGKKVVVVDDVLYTGRTVRAAMDALIEHGRPDSIQVAVMVDRGHRELPIRADFVGKNIPTGRDERVHVRLTPIDDTDGVWIEGGER